MVSQEERVAHLAGGLRAAGTPENICWARGAVTVDVAGHARLKLEVFRSKDKVVGASLPPQPWRRGNLLCRDGTGPIIASATRAWVGCFFWRRLPDCRGGSSCNPGVPVAEARVWSERPFALQVP